MRNMNDVRPSRPRLEGVVFLPENTRRGSSIQRPSNAAATTPLQNVADLASQSRYARRGIAVSPATIRVLLVDDHAIVRDGLRALLKCAPDIQVVGEATNGVEALAVARRTAPDVVVMDLDMPGGNGEEATVELSHFDPAPKVLILTMHNEEERLVPLLKDGARGYLSKDCADHDLIDAIRVVASGEFFVRPTVARILAANAIQRSATSAVDEQRRLFERLSPRERAVLRDTAAGYSGVEIARMLGITPKTIDTYKNRIGQKLGFAHRTDYVRFALRLGLLGDDGGREGA
jgi:two-component system, NarL family, response regulator NreC